MKFQIERVETERLTMRMFRESDLDEYAEMCSDADVMKYLGGATMTRSEAWRSMATVLGHWQLRGFGLWAVEERTTGKLAGRVGCWQPEGWPGIELGWALRKGFWGKGYASESAAAALDVAFSRLRILHVISLIQPANGRSIRVAKQLGMRLEGQTILLDRPVQIYGLRRPVPETVRSS